MSIAHFANKIQALADHAWDQEVRWPQVEAWMSNFTGEGLNNDRDEEMLYALFALSRFMYFGKRMVREMLRSLYRDHFESPMIQRIRRNYRDTKDAQLLRQQYDQELKATRFLGVGNPSESGAHLLYFFRQVNYLEKGLFADLSGAFVPTVDRQDETKTVKFVAREPGVSRYVFFDDLVGSGTQANQYLSRYLDSIRQNNKDVELRFLCLFATTHGLASLNAPHMFNGNASCLFELDETYKAFEDSSRYFASPPTVFLSGPFSLNSLREIALHYGNKIRPGLALGYKEGQLLLGFSHNTPDNSLPIFWDEGHNSPWTPVFIRYDKKY